MIFKREQRNYIFLKNFVHVLCMTDYSSLGDFLFELHASIRDENFSEISL